MKVAQPATEPLVQHIEVDKKSDMTHHLHHTKPLVPNAEINMKITQLSTSSEYFRT